MPGTSPKQMAFPSGLAVSVARSDGAASNVNVLRVPEVFSFEVPPQRRFPERREWALPSVSSGASTANKGVRKLHQNRYEDSAVEGWSPNVPFSLVEGAFPRPTLLHDHGFLAGANPWELDESKRQPPTAEDHAMKLVWLGVNEGARTLRPDLFDACLAYGHFLSGGGALSRVRYEAFLADDSAGVKVLASVLEDTWLGAVRTHDALRAEGRDAQAFMIQSAVASVGGKEYGGRYPYPGTENWQKTIGEHPLWIDAVVTVRRRQGRRHFSVSLVVNVEDMYNFNPGAADQATGLADAHNGRFEVVGLGHEYLNTATVRRRIEFEVSDEPLPESDDRAGSFDVTRPGR